MSAELQTGTVTFLFTDMEGSTKLLQQVRDQYAQVLGEQRELVRAAVERWHGREVDTEGDAFFIAFARATDAVHAAVEAQRALLAHSWPEGVSVGVRMGLHTGEPLSVADGYVGLDVHRAARIAAAGHGGQVLLSQTTRDLVEGALPEDVGLSDLGSHMLKDLQSPEHIYQLVIAGLPFDFPPLKSLDHHPNNLTTQPTPLLGRQIEVALLRELVLREDVRLITLTGPGGTGKTRLALQIAAELVNQLENGAFFVALAPIQEATLVASTIARTLGLKEVAGRAVRDSLVEYLENKKMLLVLDNFEQLLDAAPLVAELGAACPHLKLLVTSRATLHLRSEHEFAVPPLAVPSLQDLPELESLSEFASVRLFVERAQALMPDFALTQENAAAVAEICFRLEGLPLAIELAASRVKLLPPRAIVRRLDQRLKFLAGGPRDLPTRQQTLYGTISWSYDLLTESERLLFRRVGVFIGGWSLEAAEVVCQAASDVELDILEGLSSLLDKSLLRQHETQGSAPRFTMLELIREFAIDKLQANNEADAIRQQHALFFLALAQEAQPYLEGAQGGEWMARLEQEHDNLRAALRWCIEIKEAEVGLALGAALKQFWFIRGYMEEGRQSLVEILQLADQELPTSAYAAALDSAGFLARYQGDLSAAFALIEKGLIIRRALGDHQGIADSLNNLGYVAFAQGDYATARSLYEESIPMHRRWGNDQGVADALSHIPLMAYYAGDYERARSVADEALKLWRKLGDGQGIAWGLHVLGVIALRQHQEAQAAELFSEGMRIAGESGYKWSLATSLEDLAALAFARHDPVRALQVAGAAASVRAETGFQMPQAAQADLDQWLDAARSQLGAQEAAAAWTEGRALKLEQAIGLALSDTNQLDLYQRRG